MPFWPDIAASGIENALIARLPPRELAELRPHLQRVTLVQGQAIYEAGAPVEEVYFVENGLVSLIADTGDGGQVEVGMTGRDGVAGVAALLDAQAHSAHRCLVQVPGIALRLSAPQLRLTAARCPTLRDVCFRYAELLLVQTSQIAACNARHELPQRLARWLLTARDILGQDELPLTQELLSLMLGVRRAGVSMVLGALQAQGVILQSRGRLTVVDSAGLTARACACYRLLSENHARLGGP